MDLPPSYKVSQKWRSDLGGVSAVKIPTTSERLRTLLFVCVVVIDSGKRAKIDQDDLETVIPSAGRQVVILVGEKRGHIGELVKVSLINSFQTHLFQP